jgi:hypothetical protein
MKELIKFQDVNTDKGELANLPGLRPINRFRPLSVFEQASNRNLGLRPIIKVLNVFKVVNYPFLEFLLNIITINLNNYFTDGKNH